MASFRTGIKIISDVSKRQGRALLQRSISTEYLLGLRGNRSAPGSRSTSSPDGEDSDMTQLVADENVSWFAPFTTRQEKRDLRPASQTQAADTSTRSGRKFLVATKGPQTPNRYFSAVSAEYCKREPPPTFKGPHPSERDGHKNTSKTCFQDDFKPKEDLKKKEEEESGVKCGGKVMLEKTGGQACENKKPAKTFTVCPEPTKKRDAFRCVEVPKKIRKPKPKKVVVEKCEEPKPPPFKICPEPPARKLKPMCLVLSGNYKEKVKAAEAPPKPPPTPRRCVCEGDPEYEDVMKKPPLYKMNPDIPFKVCSKNQTHSRETFKWDSTNRQCEGASRGSCASVSSDSKQGPQKTAACKSISGSPCVGEKSCPFNPPPPPSEGKASPECKVAAPTGPQLPSVTSPVTPPPAAPAPKKDQPPPAPPKQVSSPTPEPKKAPSLTSASKPPSAVAPAPKPALSATSLPKPALSATSLPKPALSATSLPKPALSATSLPKPALSATSLPKPALSATSLPKPRPPTTAPTSSAGKCETASSNSSSPQSSGKHSAKKERDTTSSGGACKKFSLPGCNPPVRTDCSEVVSVRKACVKIPVPTPCFTDCYKGPCPPKICNPCPCVHVTHLTECDISFITRHLQPRAPIFMKRKKFVVPPPEVEVVIDPLLVACCEGDKTPAPQPLTCEPAMYVDRSPTTTCIPGQTDDKKDGCDGTVMKFIGSLMSYLRGETKDPGSPPDEVMKAAKSMDDCQGESVSKTPYSAPPSPSSVTDSSSTARVQPPSASQKDKGVASSSKCASFKMPGCRDRVRQDCTVVSAVKDCIKRYCPRPSFSECVRREFPAIKCTECRIAMKRARSLMELRHLGIRVTPENLQSQCSKCLFPTTRDCGTYSVEPKEIPMTGQAKRVPVGAAPATKNPPRPSRQCAGPSGGSKPHPPPKPLSSSAPQAPSSSAPQKLGYQLGSNPACPDDGNICDGYDFTPYRLPKEV